MQIYVKHSVICYSFWSKQIYVNQCILLVSGVCRSTLTSVFHYSFWSKQIYVIQSVFYFSFWSMQIYVNHSVIC